MRSTENQEKESLFFSLLTAGAQLQARPWATGHLEAFLPNTEHLVWEKREGVHSIAGNYLEPGSDSYFSPKIISSKLCYIHFIIKKTGWEIKGSPRSSHTSEQEPSPPLGSTAKWDEPHSKGKPLLIARREAASISLIHPLLSLGVVVETDGVQAFSYSPVPYNNPQGGNSSPPCSGGGGEVFRNTQRG